MKNKALNTMESQHTMSTTMLEMRDQIEQLSKFMSELATKLEIAMNRGVQETVSSIHGIESQSRAIKRSQNSSSSNSFSSKSRMSHDSSSQDSSVYRSPEKKKQRPKEPVKKNKEQAKVHPPEINKTTMSRDYSTAKKPRAHDSSEHSDPDEEMSNTSDVCLNLENAFESLKSHEMDNEIFQQTSATKEFIVNEDSEQKMSQKAPLHSQYTKHKDSAGVNTT
jgi:hypothetical protein